MSQTISVGVVGPSYWTYMATVMWRRLRKIASARRIETGSIPQGVYTSAQEFFLLVLQGVSDTLAENPLASINAYIIASDVARESSPHVRQTRQDLTKCLEDYSSFINSLANPRELNAEEVETVKSLEKFFLKLRFGCVGLPILKFKLFYMSRFFKNSLFPI